MKEIYTPGDKVELLVTLKSKLKGIALKGTMGIVKAQQNKTLMVETDNGELWLFYINEVKEVQK